MNQEDLTDFHVKGGLETFRSLFDLYFAPLCIYALRFTKDKSTAEEIVQETFVKLWEQRENIVITESVPGFLYKSVQNNAINYLKKEQIRNKYYDAYSDQLQRARDYFAISMESGLSVLLAKEIESKILEAVDSLPEKCKDIFMLSRFAGLKNQEIAEKKKVTLNTVQKQISIALEKLRKSLDSYLPKMIHLLIVIDAARGVL